MRKAPTPDSEQIEELWSLNVLDTAPEERYDRVTRIAQSVFDVPYVLVSLLDQCRQWFKSNQGLDASETTRDISFCGHLTVEEGFLEVPDALADSRFRDNPLVTGPPNIRFYAGQGLRGPSRKHVLGTLCLLDTKPRQLSDKQKTLLRDLGSMVEHEMAAMTLSHEMKRLRGRQQDLYEYFDGSSDLIQSVDVKGALNYVNHGWLKRLSYKLNSLPSSVLDVIAPASQSDFTRLVEGVFAGAPSAAMDLELVTSKGDVFPVKGYALKARELGLDVVRATFRDVSMERRTRERLSEEATTDPLTGLLNRRGFEERVELALRDMKTFDNEGCVAMVDIDHFKAINDAGGHLAGDRVLQHISNIISEMVPKQCAIGRWGGDEISILLTRMNPDSARSILGRVRARVAAECEATISVGISAIDANESYSDAIGAADRALYQAKESGRNVVRVVL